MTASLFACLKPPVLFELMDITPSPALRSIRAFGPPFSKVIRALSRKDSFRFAAVPLLPSEKQHRRTRVGPNGVKKIVNIHPLVHAVRNLTVSGALNDDGKSFPRSQNVPSVASGLLLYTDEHHRTSRTTWFLARTIGSSRDVGAGILYGLGRE